jgi:glycosyltransferase involved in cell wall biosynthesis
MYKLSIITPCFNEESNVDYFFDRIENVFSSGNLNGSYELIIVDDCSTDDTVNRIKERMLTNSNVKLILNSRNYGVYRSSFSALQYASGEWIVPMLPIDLQDPPEVVLSFLKETDKGCLIIAGARYDRNENFLMKRLRRAYYRFVTKFSEYEIPPFVGEFQLVHHSVISKIVKVKDHYPYIRALIARTSSSRIIIPYTWEKRMHGKTKHNLLKLYDHGINGIVSTSVAPLRFMTLLGSIIAALCIVLVIVQIIAFFTFSKGETPAGTNTLIVGMFFCLGLVFVFLGIIGEYIAAIHSQVRVGLEVHSQMYEKNE